MGWGLANKSEGVNDGSEASTLAWHVRGLLLCEPHFKFFGYLANEYAVNMFSCILEMHLNLIKTVQLHLAAQDTLLMGCEFIPDNENIYLPASFMGSKQWCANQTTDSLALAAKFPTSNILGHIHM